MGRYKNVQCIFEFREKEILASTLKLIHCHFFANQLTSYLARNCVLYSCHNFASIIWEAAAFSAKKRSFSLVFSELKRCTKHQTVDMYFVQHVQYEQTAPYSIHYVIGQQIGDNNNVAD